MSTPLDEWVLQVFPSLNNQIRRFSGFFSKEDFFWISDYYKANG